MFRLKLKRLPEGSESELVISDVETTMQTLSERIARELQDPGPHKFLFNGHECPPLTTLRSIGIQEGNDELVYMKDIVHQEASRNSGRTNSFPTTPSLPPFLANIFANNPEMVMSMMNSMPQMQALRQARPELNAFFNDSSNVKELLRTMGNPAASQEMMRHADTAMRNIDAVPGGFNVLRQLYQDTQVSPAAPAPSNEPPRDYTRHDDEEDAPFPAAWTKGGGARISSEPSPFMNLPSQPGQSGVSPLTSLLQQTPVQVTNQEPVDPHIRFAVQLNALKNMGFDDEARCIQILERMGGSLNRSLDELLKQG